MAGRLDHMLQPGERVVFRTRLGKGHFGAWAMAVGFLAVGPAVTLILPDGKFAAMIGGATALPGFALAVFLARSGAEAVLTDLRLLYRGGLLRRGVVEIPLWHIERLDAEEGEVTIRDRTGATVALRALPDPAGLAAAVRAETGVPGPAELDPGLARWANGGFSAALWTGIAAMVVSPVLGVLLYDLPAVKGALRAMDMGPVFQFGAFALAAVWTAGFYFVGVLGAALGLAAAMHARLPAAAARRIFDVQMARRETRWMHRAWRLALIPARRLASLLYGEPV